MQEYGGISRYFVELIKQFEEHPELGIEPILNLDKAVNNLAIQQSHKKIVKIKAGLSQYLALLITVLKRNRNQHNVDLIHWTFYTPGFIGRFAGIPKVATLYDMIPEVIGGRGRFGNPHLFKRSFIRRADLVFSISACSTRDMNRIYQIEKAAITTYLGVGDEFSDTAQKPSWIEGEYFLYVGQRDGYKDISTAYRALANVNNQDTILILVGGGPLKSWESELLEDLNLTRRILQVNALDVELPGIYSNALALLFPSNYEGFGFPPIEAMASSTVAFVAETEVSKEICKDAAAYFPIKDYKSLAKLMNKAITSPNTFNELTAKGLELATQYTWYNCARETAKGYKKLLSEHQGNE